MVDESRRGLLSLLCLKKHKVKTCQTNSAAKLLLNVWNRITPLGYNLSILKLQSVYVQKVNLNSKAQINIDTIQPANSRKPCHLRPDFLLLCSTILFFAMKSRPETQPG